MLTVYHTLSYHDMTCLLRGCINELSYYLINRLSCSCWLRYHTISHSFHSIHSSPTGIVASKIRGSIASCGDEEDDAATGAKGKEMGAVLNEESLDQVIGKCRNPTPITHKNCTTLNHDTNAFE